MSGGYVAGWVGWRGSAPVAAAVRMRKGSCDPYPEASIGTTPLEVRRVEDSALNSEVEQQGIWMSLGDTRAAAQMGKKRV